MKAQAVEPTGNLGWIETELDKEYMDYLWMIVKEGKAKGLNHKHALAGNITNSFEIKDRSNFFYKNVLVHHMKGYVDEYGRLPVLSFTDTRSFMKMELSLTSLWANYQYKHEFNPSHRHSGVYSFVIWMKIPYDWKEQNKLPFLDGIEETDKKPGLFEFEYIDILGEITNFSYMLNSDYEGTMLFFPAQLKHCVYPFYKTDEPRISISGNIGFVPA